MTNPKTVKEVLEKLVQDPELKKYPHSYNPIIIEKAQLQLDALYKAKYLGIKDKNVK